MKFRQEENRYFFRLPQHVCSIMELIACTFIRRNNEVPTSALDANCQAQVCQVAVSTDTRLALSDICGHTETLRKVNYKRMQRRQFPRFPCILYPHMCVCMIDLCNMFIKSFLYGIMYNGKVLFKNFSSIFLYFM